MYGPRCAVSDTNAWAGVATASRRARTRAFMRAGAAHCAGFRADIMLRKELQCTFPLALGALPLGYRCATGVCLFACQR